MRVLHVGGTAVLGRSPEKWYRDEFRKHGIFLDHYSVDNTQDFIDKAKKYDWVFFGWEMEPDIGVIGNYPYRNYHTLVYAQEQPQRLGEMKWLRESCDVLITSAPTFQEGTNGWIPFPIHTAYSKSEYGFITKRNEIIISGSYRKCRYELFERLLSEQPFEWPVKFLPSGLEWEPIGKSEYQSLVDRFPDYVVAAPKKHGEYIPELLRALAGSKAFIDMTFNPYPDLHMSQGHASLADVLALKNYKGGYMPERVLDACYWGCYPFCFKNPAIEYVLGGNAGYYNSYEELVDKVSAWIAQPDRFLPDTSKCSHAVQAHTAQNVIKQFADMFKALIGL